jgi:hypothetical protein
MLNLFTGQEANLQWDAPSNFVNHSASTFDLSSFEWSSLEYDGSAPALLGDTSLPSNESVQQRLHDWTLAAWNPDDASGVVNVNTEFKTRKQNNNPHVQPSEQSDLSATEVRNSPFPDLVVMRLNFTGSGVGPKSVLLNEPIETERKP